MRKLGFMKKVGFIIGIIALLMAVMPMSDGLAVQAADPDPYDEEWYWKPGDWIDYAQSGMPDFDQRQDTFFNVSNPPPPMGPWTYCGPVAVANSLWWFDSRGEPFPIPPPTVNDNYPLVTSYGAWDDHSVSNVEPLVEDLAYLMDTDGQRTGFSHNGTDVFDMEEGIRQYLINTSCIYYYEKTVPNPYFYWIEDEVYRCEDVILLLGFWQEQYEEPGWHRIGGHYVTVAGVNSYTWQLGLSDPYWDNAEAGGQGRIPVPHNHTAAGAGTHNDTQYVSHDIYDVTDWWCPGSDWALVGYAEDKDISNFTRQNCPEEFEWLQGDWDQNPEFPVYTQIEYAVVVSPKENITEVVIDSDYDWAKAEENVSVRVHVWDEGWSGTIYDIDIYFWTEENGTELVYSDYFDQDPLLYCMDYYYDVPWNEPFLPEKVVLHLSNVTEDNIGYAISYPVWYWKPGGWEDYALSGVPDFDQKQDNWTHTGTAEGDWTHCGPVAVANSLWYFDSREEPDPQPPSISSDHYGLVTAYGPWDDHNVSNVEPLVNDLAALMNTGPTGTDVMDMQKGIDKYLVNRSYYGYYYEKTVKEPNFSWIEEEVERCEDVILLLGFWQEQLLMEPEPSYYWVRIGGHYVTCAGVNSKDWQLGISDPYFDKRDRVPVNHTYPHNATVHNDTQYVSHDIYYVYCDSICPGGPCILEDYVIEGPEVWNFQFQNCPEEFWDFQGAWDPEGSEVVTQIDYAIAVSPKPDLNEVIESDYNFTEENNVTIRVHVINETWDDMIWDMDILLWNSTSGTQVSWNGTQLSWPHREFDPLQYCENYTFNVSFGSYPPEKVVLHFSNYDGDNIGFAFSYPEGVPATLVGNVTPGRIELFDVRAFEGGNLTKQIWQAFQPGNLTGQVWADTGITNNTGFFTIPNLTADTYDIVIKNWSFLSEVVTKKLNPGTTTLVDFGSIRVGDANNNDAVNIMDLVVACDAFGADPNSTNWDPNCDFNRNDKVNIMDLVAACDNFGDKGALNPYG